MIDELNDPLRHTLEELLEAYGFQNLNVVKRFRIRNKVEGYVGERWMFAIKDRTCQQLFPKMDEHPHGYGTPELFRAFVGEDGEQRFTNFVSASFPLMKDGLREFLERKEMAFPNSIQYLPDMFQMLYDALHAELEQLRINHTPENAQRLLSVRLALGSSIISGASTATGLPKTLVEWLREDVELTMLLYAFGPRSGKTSVSQLAEPLIPLAEAKQAAGIPLRRLRVLYPDLDSQDFDGF